MDQHAVWDIQNALRKLHFQDSRLPPIFPNGFYDILTENAVRIYQQTRGLPETGTVDPLTFRTLTDEAVASDRSNALALPVFSRSDIRMDNGQSDDGVWFVQTILHILSRDYLNIPNVTVNGQYNRETANAVKAVQAIQRREATGILDTETWNDLVRLFQTRPMLGSVQP